MILSLQLLRLALRLISKFKCMEPLSELAFCQDQENYHNLTQSRFF